MNDETLMEKDDQRVKTLIQGLIAFCLSFSLLLGLSSFVRVVISETDSLPQHYFLHLPFCSPKLKAYTMLYSPWYGKKIIKQIAGVENDKIWYDEARCLWVNQTKIGKLKSLSQDNRKLTPIPTQVIPKGFVFVYAEHPFSFDSRYQELGLIPVSSLEGRLIPLK